MAIQAAHFAAACTGCGERNAHRSSAEEAGAVMLNENEKNKLDMLDIVRCKMNRRWNHVL